MLNQIPKCRYVYRITQSEHYSILPYVYLFGIFTYVEMNKIFLKAYL